MLLRKYILGTLVVLLLASLTSAQEIELKLKANKNEYVCGEPVLLRTVVTNSSDKDVLGDLKSYGWANDRGFTFYIARGQEASVDINNRKKKLPWPVSRAPLQFDRFYDRHRLSNSLKRGQQTQRLDMLILPQPGEYKIKAVLKNRDQSAHQSIVVKIKVLTIDQKYDSIEKLGNQDFIINLGSTIYYAHYMEKLLGRYPPGNSLMPKVFEKIAPTIMDKHKDSNFREYVMYADIMAHGRQDIPRHPLIDTKKLLAEQFIREYPKSWLLPEVCRRLFWTYLSEKNIDNAAQVRDLAVQKSPNAAFLRVVKKTKLHK
ncbi:MAG: hypothetical protein ACYSWP_14155 [Planctomycetota bacterium]